VLDRVPGATVVKARETDAEDVWDGR
jgi:hypothetical protein